MRIWDIPPGKLCRRHLLGEHSELHAIWSIITNKRRGYSSHPEVMRWRGRLKALYMKHGEIAAEMERRGFSHQSPLDIRLAKGLSRQKELVDSLPEQRRRLRGKGCGCSA